MSPPDWKPVFDYLEHESRFQAAAAAITGAAAAWWLKALLSSAPGATLDRHPRLSRLAAALMALSSFLFFAEEGRLSKKYGELASMLAAGKTPSDDWVAILVRGKWEWASLVQWSPYFAARLLLYVIAGIVFWMLYRDLASDSTHRDQAP